MANYPGALVFQITDVNGDTAEMAITSLFADTATIATITTLIGAVGALIVPVTNGKVTSTGARWGVTKAQISTATAPPPANATYPSVTDGAALSFRNSAGGARRVVIPAPLLTDFIAGTNTVNPAQADMAALIAELEALSDLDGATNLYEGGVKTGRHSRRRVTRKHL